MYRTLSGMADIRVEKDVLYTGQRDENLRMDLYLPPSGSTDGERPAVIFIHGEPSPKLEFNVRNRNSYRFWGRLAAASGFVGVAFEHRLMLNGARLATAGRDVEEAVAFLRRSADDFSIDRERLAFWTCSAGPPVGISPWLPRFPAYVRCLVIYYGLLDLRHLKGRPGDLEKGNLDSDSVEVLERVRPDDDVSDDLLERFSPLAYLENQDVLLPPTLLARAGKDYSYINEVFDRFVERALSLDIPLELLNHPKGRHAFDVLSDDGRTREIVARTMEFLQHHLGSTSASGK